MGATGEGATSKAETLKLANQVTSLGGPTLVAITIVVGAGWDVPCSYEGRSRCQGENPASSSPTQTEQPDKCLLEECGSGDARPKFPSHLHI